jgi:hypothetical protein
MVVRSPSVEAAPARLSNFHVFANLSGYKSRIICLQTSVLGSHSSRAKRQLADHRARPRPTSKGLPAITTLDQFQAHDHLAAWYESGRTSHIPRLETINVEDYPLSTENIEVAGARENPHAPFKNIQICSAETYKLCLILLRHLENRSSCLEATRRGRTQSFVAKVHDLSSYRIMSL